MFDTNLLLVWLIFSSIWMWYFIYWKKDQNYIFSVSWLILMIYPYFVENIYNILLPLVLKFN